MHCDTCAVDQRSWLDGKEQHRSCTRSQAKAGYRCPRKRRRHDVTPKAAHHSFAADSIKLLLALDLHNLARHDSDFCSVCEGQQTISQSLTGLPTDVMAQLAGHVESSAPALESFRPTLSISQQSKYRHWRRRCVLIAVTTRMATILAGTCQRVAT